MKKMLAMALTTILALTAVVCGGALAAGSVVAPVDVSNTQVDYQNGTYWARIRDTDKIKDHGYFTADLYVQDLYAADQVWALQAGDKVKVNGKTYTVKSLQPDVCGGRHSRLHRFQQDVQHRLRRHRGRLGAVYEGR